MHTVILFLVWPYFQPNKRFSFIISSIALSLLHISSIFKLHKLEESDVLLLCYFRDPASYSGLNDRLLTFIRNAFIKHYDLDIQVYPFSLTRVLSLLQIFNMFNEIYICFREESNCVSNFGFEWSFYPTTLFSYFASLTIYRRFVAVCNSFLGDLGKVLL